MLRKDRLEAAEKLVHVFTVVFSRFHLPVPARLSGAGFSGESSSVSLQYGALLPCNDDEDEQEVSGCVGLLFLIFIFLLLFLSLFYFF